MSTTPQPPHTLLATETNVGIYLVVYNASQAVRKKEYLPDHPIGSHKESTTRPRLWKGGYMSLTETGPNILQLLVYDHGLWEGVQLECFKNDGTPIENAFDVKRLPLSKIPLQRLGISPWLESRKFGFHRTSFDIYGCQRSQHFFDRPNSGYGGGLVFLKLRYTILGEEPRSTDLFPTFIHSKIPYQKHSQLQQINSLFSQVNSGEMEPLEKAHMPEHPSRSTLFDGKFILGKLLPCNISGAAELGLVATFKGSPRAHMKCDVIDTDATANLCLNESTNGAVEESH